MPEDKAVDNAAQLVEIGAKLESLGTTVIASVDEKLDGMVTTESFEKATTELAKEQKKNEELAEQVKDLSGKFDNLSKETVKVLDGYENPDNALGKFAKHVQLAACGNMMHDDLKAHQKMINEKLAGQNETVGSDGGFTVPTVVESGIQKYKFIDNPLVSGITRKSSANTPLWKKVLKKQTDSREGISGGAVTYRIPEGGALTLSDVAWETISIPIIKMGTYTKATDELLADSTENITAELGRDMETSEANKIMAEFISGTGVLQMEGIQNAPSLVTVAKESGQAADSIEAPNIWKMYNRMYPEFRQRAVFVITPAMANELPEMNVAIGTGGSLVWMPAGGISGAPFQTLYGRPIVESAYLPEDVGDLHDIMFVDPSQYWMIDIGSMTDSSKELFWLTGEQAFKLVSRNGGKMWMPRALPTVPAGSYTQSAVITLAARA